MKKYLLLIILLLIPFIVKAEDFEYTIKSKVTLDGKGIKIDEFTFDLIDVDGNIIQTKKNDQEGNIVFDPITFKAEDATEHSVPAAFGNWNNDNRKVKYYFYTIKQRNDNAEGYTYDEEPGYVGVWIWEDGSSRVDYLKNVEEIKKESTAYKVKEGSKIYHATEEELQGQAYAVYDSTDKTLTFFRDEVGKYTDSQVLGTKTYYTGFEEGYHPTWRRFRNYSTYTIYDEVLIDVKKIVFEDPIKPQMISDPNGKHSSWFLDMYYLEEIENINLLDTSNVPSFKHLFESDQELKTLDLSTWDTSNVTDMQYMFQGCKKLEEAYIDNFDTSKVTDTYQMFQGTYKLQWVNQSVFNFQNMEGTYDMFTQSNAIKGLDMSTWNPKASLNNGCIATNMESLQYVNVSPFAKIDSEGIGQNFNLSIIDFGSEYEYIYSNIGPLGSIWYNLKTQKLYNKDDLIHHFRDEKDLEPATYIRPFNNPEPPVFRNSYVEIIEEKQSFLENPSTSDGILIIMGVTILLGIISYICYKKALFYN